MIYMEDIRKRQTYQSIRNTLYEYSVDLLFENSKKTSSINTVETYFKNWPYDKNENYYEFNEAVEILEGFIKRAKSTSDKNKAVTLFCEMVLPKTNNMKAAKHVLESLHLDIDTSELITECDKYIVCDRILNNHKRLIDKGIMGALESVSSQDLDSYVTAICEFVDNIDMEFSVKYNVALENTLYLLDKQGIYYDRKSILESINDYFFINLDEKKVQVVEVLLSENKLYSQVDKVKSKADDLLQEIKSLPNKTPESIKQVIRKLYAKSPDNILEELPNFLTWIRKFMVFSTLAISPYLGIVALLADLVVQAKIQRSETEKIIKSFNREKEKAEKKLDSAKSSAQKDRLKQYIKQLDKDIDKLKEYEETLYSEKENNERYESEMNESAFEFEDYVTLKEYVEIFHPKVVKQMYDLKSMLEKYTGSKYKKIIENGCLLINPIDELKKFENANINTILNYIASDDNKVYIDVAKFLGVRFRELKDKDTAVDVLSDICDSLQLNIDYDFCLMYEGDEDLYTIYLSYNKPVILDDGTDNVVEEQVHNSVLKAGGMILALEEEVSKISEREMDYLLDFVDDNIDRMDMATVDCVGQFSVVASDIVKPSAILDIFEEKANEIRRKDKTTGKYVKLAKIQEGIDAIKNSPSIDSRYISVYDTYLHSKLLSESIDLVDQIVHETGVPTVLKMAQEKLKNNIKGLSDKEKATSRQLDFAVDSMVNKMQMAATNNNREAVIKGSIIPSASKVIKLAIGSAAVWAINPAIAVIGVLGGIAASKAANAKERQYILDEIDTQMKVVEKKVQMAERNDDMKTYEELLKIEQKLKREKSRIEYHKKDYIPVRKDN